MRMQNVSTLYRWISEMLEGDELEESMTLCSGGDSSHPAGHDGAQQKGRMRRIRCS